MPKPFIFVLMPFDKDFDDVYHMGIKPACNNAGAYAERVDEQLFQESILDRIYNQISKADVIIADMSGRNPNVFYETGYAHALGKKVILLTKESDDIPFDLKHYPHIVYGGRIKDLLPELEKRVKWAIEQPVGSTPTTSVDFYVDGKNLLTSPTIVIKPDNWELHTFDIGIDACNPIEHKIQKEEFQIGFVTSDRIGQMWKPAFRNTINLTSFRLPTGDVFFLLNTRFEMLPGAWESTPLSIAVSEGNSFQKGETIPLILRKLSEKGVEHLPFAVNFE